jgi:hypothetical protein
MEPTLFYPINNARQFTGYGVNTFDSKGSLLSNYLGSLDLSWSRLYIKSANPGTTGVYYTDSDWDNFWLADSSLVSGSIRFSYSALQQKCANVIMTMNQKHSFLKNNGNNVLNGDSLVAFARYWVSCIYIFRLLGMPINYIELCENVQSPTITAYISPANYVLLVTTFRQILAERNITGIYVLGPSIDTMSISQISNPYIQAFAGTTGLLDFWCLHVYEPYIDKCIYNKGDLTARMYTYTTIGRIVNLMKGILPNIPIFITKFTSNATRFSQGIDLGHQGSGESGEYLMRLSDSVCNAINTGVSAIIFWNLFGEGNCPDYLALFRPNSSSRPFLNVINGITHNMFSFGTPKTFTNHGIYPTGDETLKAILVDGNGFVMTLSRAQLTDSYNGNVLVSINNPLWNAVNGYTIALSFYESPAWIQPSIHWTASVANNILSISLSNVNYSSTIFVVGTLSPLLLTSPPPQFESIQILKVFTLPVSGTIGQIIIYNGTLYTWNGSSWILAST